MQPISAQAARLQLANGGVAKVGLTSLRVDEYTSPLDDYGECGEFVAIGGLDIVEIHDEGAWRMVACPTSRLKARAKRKPHGSTFHSADASVVLNHTDRLGFDRALSGGGRIVQLADTTEMVATLAAAPQRGAAEPSDAERGTHFPVECIASLL